MSTYDRRILLLVSATILVLALAGAATYASSVGYGSAETGVEATVEKVDGVKVRKETNNKGKSSPGMCVYDENQGEFRFKNVPKGNMDENDPILNVLDKGGDFADSQADCDVLNTERANPPENHKQSDVVEVNIDPDAASEPPDMPYPNATPGDMPPEAVKAQEAYEKRHGGENKAGEPKAKHKH